MEWIKKNKVLVIAIVVAVLAIGGSGYFAFAQYQVASKAAEELSAARTKWERLEQSNPHPGTIEVDNIELANEDKNVIDTLFDSAAEMMSYMPYLAITNDRTMRGAMESEVYDLTELALLSGVAIPDEYNFTFDGPMAMFSYETNSIEKLQFHLANVSMLTRTLYGDKVHSLESIKRPRVDESDDYSDGIIDAQPTDGDFYIRTPYEITFKGFSREFGEVIESLAEAQDCVVIKAMKIEASELPKRKKAEEEKKKLSRRRRPSNPYAGMNPYGMGGRAGGANPYGGMGGGAYGGMGGAYGGNPYGGMGGAYGGNPYGGMNPYGGIQRDRRGVETVETDLTFDEEIEEKPLEIQILLDLVQLKPTFEDADLFVQAVLAPPPEGEAEAADEDEDEDEDEDDE